MIRLLIGILLFSVFVVYLNGGPLEKQLELKSQPSLNILNTNYNHNFFETSDIDVIFKNLAIIRYLAFDRIGMKKIRL